MSTFIVVLSIAVISAFVTPVRAPSFDQYGSEGGESAYSGPIPSNVAPQTPGESLNVYQTRTVPARVTTAERRLRCRGGLERVPGRVCRTDRIPDVVSQLSTPI